MIIAVAGSGGKTTRIHKLAEKYCAEGKRVLVTTTTHMFAEKGCDLSGSVESIQGKLSAYGYCMAGLEAENGKIRALPGEVYEKVCEYADIVLVEADGSKGQPVKYPAVDEPVIPENAEEIHIVTGLSALGRPLGEVSHRTEYVKRCLGISEETLFRPIDLQKLVRKGYLEPLRAKYPGKKIMVYPGQVNSLYERTVARFLKEEKDVSVLDDGWFETKPKLVILGGGHVGKEIARLGSFLDFEVTVIDDRQEFVTREAFPEAEHLDCHGFDDLEEILPKEKNCYYVIVTRGHAADRVCAAQILKKDFVYIGMIGSRLKVAKTLELLKAQGFSEEQLVKLHAPIGLKIGARTPAEIAVSVAAELIQEKNKRSCSTMTAELAQTKRPGVLCIITAKTGSAPRDVGSMMLVTKDGIIGTIGGGTLEQAAIEHSAKVNSITSECYDLSNEESAALGMICGGTNEILYIPLWEEELN